MVLSKDYIEAKRFASYNYLAEADNTNFGHDNSNKNSALIVFTVVPSPNHS